MCARGATNEVGEMVMKSFTIPNFLTCFRFGVGFWLAMTAIFQSHEARSLYTLACALTALAFASDYLDGWIARKWPSQQSQLGVVIDPPADKVAVAGAMLYLVVIGAAHGGYEYLCFILIVFRELCIWIVRMTGHDGRTVSSMGKWKTAAQMSALGLYFLVPVAPSFYTPAAVMLGAALVLTWWSFIMYLYPRRAVQVNP